LDKMSLFFRSNVLASALGETAAIGVADPPTKPLLASQGGPRGARVVRIDTIFPLPAKLPEQIVVAKFSRFAQVKHEIDNRTYRRRALKDCSTRSEGLTCRLQLAGLHGSAGLDRLARPHLEQRRERTRRHLAQIAGRREVWINRNKYYYNLLSQLLRFLVEPQRRVLSVRCGTALLLAAVNPRRGKGIDIC
jgi:hypothetical protein